jgi:hypothetical protein
MKKISIYIAGSVRKDKNDENTVFASDDIKGEIYQALDGVDVTIFDPNESKILGTKSRPRFGKDCLQVTSSNFIVVDLREKRGIGVGSEMMIARQRKIPVIAVCPPESHYKRHMVFHTGAVNQEWVHPFVESLSDVIVNNFKEAGEWIKKFIDNPIEVRSDEVINESIKDYLDNYLDSDDGFKEKYLNSLYESK